MSASHHPPEDLILAYAAGSLDEASSVLVATHLALCPGCRKGLSHAEAVAGELMEDLTPAPMESAALDAALARLDTPVQAAARAVAKTADELLPQPLRDYVKGELASVKWQWKGFGVQYAPLLTDAASGYKLGLLKVAAGVRVPHHGHSDDELTMVLAGGYSNEFGAFARGDVEFADPDVKHQPVADADGPCLCLVITRGPLKPTGFIASLLMPLFAF
jgi:putative transcriptional regulator